MGIYNDMARPSKQIRYFTKYAGILKDTVVVTVKIIANTCGDLADELDKALLALT